ncbi:MAG: ATP-dependent Clp protease ATP-binding subunit [Lachnospiraceae bacterium]|nr:ATP-dependent Clp protease ATP-binding subunit [Lachnospiraceae bacterium]
MADNYSIKAKHALELSAENARELGQNYTGTEHFLLGLMDESTGVAAQVLNENNITKKDIVELIRAHIAPDHNIAIMEREGYTPRAAEVLSLAAAEAKRFRSDVVGTEHILLALLRSTDCVACKILSTMGANIPKLYADVLSAMGEDPAIVRTDLQNAFRSSQEDGQSGSVTPTLDEYSRDLTALAAQGKLDPVIGRGDEIMRVIQILNRRTKNNPCLVGEPGVGKTAIAEGLAVKIAENTVPPTLLGKRLVSIDMSGMVAGSKYRGEFEERIKNVVREVINAGNVLLFMDEIHTLIGAGGAEGAIDASSILKPSLARGEIQLIGATTIDEYRKYIEKDAALERRFQPVSVEEPDEAQAIEILKGIRDRYEDHHMVNISDEAVEAAVRMSARYINDRFLPDKAIDVMDEAASHLRISRMSIPPAIEALAGEIESLRESEDRAVMQGDFVGAGEIRRELKKKKEKHERMLMRFEKRQREKDLTLTEDDIAEVVAVWTKIPVMKLTEKENARLLKLESILHQRVIGQDEAVSKVSQAIKRGRVGLKDPSRPVGSFLFLGPTGVGKTELSKALAEAMFGSENSLIRVDMSEFMESHSVAKMIGSPPGYVGFEEGGQLSEKIRRHPYSVVLFDEIEKAHPDVFNVLLQVLDEGHITDSKGRKVSFKNAIIIMTSNAGAQRIVDPKKLGFMASESAKRDYEDMKNGVMEEVKRIFKPEFLNRIDDIIVFHTLGMEEMRQIVALLSAELVKRAKDQMELTLKITVKARDFVVKKGLDKKFGARPLRRAIQNMIENPLAMEILSGKCKAGDTVTVTVKKEQIVFERKPSANNERRKNGGTKGSDSE